MAYPGSGYWHEVRRLDDSLYATGVQDRAPSPFLTESIHNWRDEGGRLIGWLSVRVIYLDRTALGSKTAIGSRLVVTEESAPKEDGADLQSLVTQYDYDSSWFPKRLDRTREVIGGPGLDDPQQLRRQRREARHSRAVERRLGLTAPQDEDYAALLDYLRCAVAGHYQELDPNDGEA